MDECGIVTKDFPITANLSDADKQKNLDGLSAGIIDMLNGNTGCVQQLAESCKTVPLLIKAGNNGTNLYLGYASLVGDIKSFGFFESSEKDSLLGDKRRPGMVRLDNHIDLEDFIASLIVDKFAISTYEELYQEVAGAYQERTGEELIAPLKPKAPEVPAEKTLAEKTSERIKTIKGTLLSGILG